MVIRRPVISGGLLLALWPVALRAQDPAEMVKIVEGLQATRAGYDSRPLRELMESLHVPGVSVAVIKDFKIDWAKGWGLADVAAGTLVARRREFVSMPAPGDAHRNTSIGMVERFWNKPE